MQQNYLQQAATFLVEEKALWGFSVASRTTFTKKSQGPLQDTHEIVMCLIGLSIFVCQEPKLLPQWAIHCSSKIKDKVVLLIQLTECQRLIFIQC